MGHTQSATKRRKYKGSELGDSPCPGNALLTLQLFWLATLPPSSTVSRKFARGPAKPESPHLLLLPLDEDDAAAATTPEGEGPMPRRATTATAAVPARTADAPKAERLLDLLDRIAAVVVREQVHSHEHTADGAAIVVPGKRHSEWEQRRETRERHTDTCRAEASQSGHTHGTTWVDNCFRANDMNGGDNNDTVR